MCWLCDHPTATREDYLGILRTKARQNGWAVQYVESDRSPFAYTVGLHDWGRPELLITGVSPARASRLLGAMAREALRGCALKPGAQLKVTGGPLVEFVTVDHPDVHLCWAVNHAQAPIQALQVVWADGHGRWPWSATFCDGRRRQPVLGVRGRAA
ncbi:Uncharacterised protein [Mycolicibacterium aurum]|uniref:DUF4262 domain-containing protein n=1 Tax=Mycolicibacterium aurum TaxID=1791 RepID=A0A448J167_MYCAU|nr:DUF4262 domain-containing protein [Mycolicibacterium aurum]VEG58440.1 Uncharacterised protein [Mycolicibacterium aurum]